MSDDRTRHLEEPDRTSSIATCSSFRKESYDTTMVGSICRKLIKISSSRIQILITTFLVSRNTTDGVTFYTVYCGNEFYGEIVPVRKGFQRL